MINYCNGTRTHNHLIRKRTLNHLAKLACLAKWLSVRLRVKWLWLRVPLQSLNNHYNLPFSHIMIIVITSDEDMKSIIETLEQDVKYVQS